MPLGRPVKSMLANTGLEVYRYSPIVFVVPSQGPNTSSPPTRGPPVILLLRWMDAKEAHAAKYIKQYTALYPEATQIVVASPQNQFWLGDSYRERSLRVVADLLREHGVKPEDPKLSAPLLVHTFSNGGCFNLTALARLLLKLRTTKAKSDTQPAAMPASAMIYDSCPAAISIKTGMVAFTMGIKNRWLRLLSSLAVGAFLLTVKAIDRLLGRRNYTGLKDDLLDARLFPPRAPRLYIYSKADKLVPYREVEAVVSAEERAGRPVRSEVFEETAHVSHARGDERRYWGAVARTWEEAMKSE